MSFTTKNWLKRISEYPTRRRLVKSDGTSEVVDVERYEGTISQEGDAFSEENMNDLEERIKAGFDDLGGLKLMPTTKTAYEELLSNDDTDDNTIYIYKV